MAAKKKAKGSPAAQEFTWDANEMACVSTYRILEGDRFLDQFEDAEFPIEDAGDLPMSELRFFPGITDNSAGLKLLARQMARRFVSFLVKIFGAVKQDSDHTSAEIIERFTELFANGEATLTQLAEAVKEEIKFPTTAIETER
jgi:hypothetical protein